MNLMKKISIFALIAALLITVFSISVFATDLGSESSSDQESLESTEQSDAETGADIRNPDKDTEGSSMSFLERAEFALVGTVTGMLAVFAILALLWGILSISKIFFYTIPNAKKNKMISSRKAFSEPEASPAPVAAEVPAAEEETVDDGELAAVITAAVAAMLDSEEYKNEFVGGFRVVSFKRSAKSAWNKK